MRFEHRCLAIMVVAAISSINAPAFAQSLPQCAVDGAPTANGSGIVYLQYEVPAPTSTSCAANFANAYGKGLIFLQYDVPAPINVQATDGTYAGKVVITWTAGEIGSKYLVYRDGQLISPAQGISGTFFEDTTAEGYKTYSYSVAALLDSGSSDKSTADTGFSLADGVQLKLAASDGTITDRVALSWTKLAGAEGYKVYRNNTLIKTIEGDTVVELTDTDIGGSASKFNYAVSAYKGATETAKSQDTGFANQPPSQVSGTTIVQMNKQTPAFVPEVKDPNLPDDAFTFSIVSQPSNGSVSITNNQFVYTPNQNFQGEDTFVVRATDRTGATTDGTVTMKIDCPKPLMIGLNVSGDLTAVEGMAQVEMCGEPDNVLVRLKYTSGSRTVREIDTPLVKAPGTVKFYTFRDPISSLTDGTYSISATLTDAYTNTTSATTSVVIDWNASVTPKFFYKNAPVSSGGTTAETFGAVGIK